MKALKLLVTAATVGAIALAGQAYAQDKGLIGIAMPTKSSLRWISDGDELKKDLEAKGYTVDLQYAEDDIPNQLAQIENMVTKGPKALIVASIDGTTLSDVLQKAHDAGALVVAYDRLIKNSPNVDYYTTFDNFGVGVLQANSLVDGLKARFASTKPWNVELFGGSPDDNNAFFFYDGAMSVLQPLIDDKTIVIKSGQMGMDKVGTLRWDGAVAQARMDNILSANYSDGSRVDGVLAPYDGLSRGIISSLRGVGYGTCRPALADRYRSGRGSPLGEGDHRRRAVLDRLQGHPRAGQDHGRAGRRSDRGPDPVADQRHQDLQQWREGGAVGAADAVLGRCDELREAGRRLGLHQGLGPAVSRFQNNGGPALAGPLSVPADRR